MSDNLLVAGDDETVEVDISQLSTLLEQKEYCDKMLDGILYEEHKLKNRLITIQTINKAVHSDEKMMASFSEYLGYHYGRMDASRGLFDSVLSNLKNFLEGNLDDINHGARGMYISLWYNIGISSLEDLSSCVADLEKLEGEIVEIAMKDGNDDIMGETIH